MSNRNGRLTWDKFDALAVRIGDLTRAMEEAKSLIERARENSAWITLDRAIKAAGSSEPPTTAEKPATKDQMAEQFANQFNVVVNGGRDRD